MGKFYGMLIIPEKNLCQEKFYLEIVFYLKKRNWDDFV